MSRGAGDGPIVCFATQGHGHIEGERIRVLTEGLAPLEFPYERSHKLRSAAGLLKLGLRRRPRLFVMEGTGMGGGIPLILMRTLLGIPYVVCGGDAVGPYLGLRSRAGGIIGGIYERLVCRRSSGYVGWTPYLVGRAMTYGAPRGMTIPGWTRTHAGPEAREQVRERLGIPAGALVVGMTGSIQISPKRDYAYGEELVRAVRRSPRSDLAALIIGDGGGMERLRELAGEDLDRRVFLPGRVPPEQVADHLAAFDLASLSQSTDPVGAFRYTTKLSEYLAAGLPVLSAQNPLAYDLDEGYIWRLPGTAPWDPVYLDALVELLDGLGPEELAAHRRAVAERRAEPFDRATQQRRMEAFVGDLLDAARRRSAAQRATVGPGASGLERPR